MNDAIGAPLRAGEDTRSEGRPPQVISARVPPHSIEAEESLLGAMLLSEHAVSMVSPIVGADDFYKPAHRHIFDTMQALAVAGQGIDPVTVAEELDRVELLEACGGTAALVTLQTRTPAITNAEYYARIVEEKALLRRLIGAANDIAELGYSPRDDIDRTMDDAESAIFAIAQRRTTDTMKDLAPLLEAGLTNIEEIEERGEAVTGTPTGYTELDKMLAGLQPGALIVVGARPGMGKTAFALGLASHAAVRERLPVLFFSLEMGHLEITQRLIASEARVDSSKMRSGQLRSNDWSKITKAIGRLGEGTMWIDDNPAVSLMEIRSKARRLQDRLGQKLGLVVVDYLQLMQGRGAAESRQVEVAEISRGLKVLARELDAPVLALSQLSRQLEQRSDKRPMLADLRESGCLTADTRVRRADDNTEVTFGELVESGAHDVPVWSLDEHWRMVPATLSHAFPSGTKEVFRLHLSSGRRVEASANHPFRTVSGWRRLDELEPGSRIAVPRTLGSPEHIVPVAPEDLPQLAADMVAEGAAPAAVHRLPEDQLAAVLHGVLGRIGYLSVTELRGRPHVRLAATTGSRRLADDLQTLLLRFGIQARMNDIGSSRPRWRLWVHGARQQRLLLERIGFSGERATQVPEAIAVLSTVDGNPNVDTIPCEVRDLVVEKLREAEMTQRDLAGALGEQYCGGYLLGTESRPRASSRERLARIADVLGSKELAELADSDVLWDEVLEVEALGEKPTYDATVSGTHNFVANGVVAHNSIEQDADVVMFLYRDEKYNPDSAEKDTAEVIVAKHRAGPSGVCRLVFLDYCTLFANMATD
ncbi:MAG: replicative DNA helicase [Actinomycetia bacterium]|nr:replicative DNA helicase [Actinomycetes bacterium]